MSEEIIKVLDELGKRFGMAIDWSNQNVMPYLQDLMNRYISYNNVQSITWIIVSIIIILLCCFFIKKLLRWSKQENFGHGFNDDEFIFSICMIGCLSLILIFSIISFIKIQQLAQNIFIPELTVLEYLKVVK